MIYDRLNAVNEILSTAGESLVNSLGIEGSTDTSLAEFVLDQTTLDVQLRGLTGGVYTTTLNKTSNDEFILPEGTTEFVALDTADAVNAAYAHLVLRDGKVWNATDGTHLFTDDDFTQLSVRVTRVQAWEELPLAVKKGIVATAAVDYCVKVGADDKTVQRAYQREATLRSVGKSSDLAARQTNILATGGTPTRATSRTFGWSNGRLPRW